MPIVLWMVFTKPWQESKFKASKLKTRPGYTICQGPRSHGESGHYGRLQDQIAGPSFFSGDVGPISVLLY